MSERSPTHFTQRSTIPSAALQQRRHEALRDLLRGDLQLCGALRLRSVQKGPHQAQRVTLHVAQQPHVGKVHHLREMVSRFFSSIDQPSFFLTSLDGVFYWIDDIDADSL